MTRRTRHWVVFGTGISVVLALPIGLWSALTYEPTFYRARAEISPERRRAVARQFVQQSLQLRNDIMNEPRWEAVFSDEEVNAWLAQDLVEHFADQIPPGVQDPRVAFEPDRATLAFKLDRGLVDSLIWVVVRVEVPEPNVLALTVEKIRAGVMPVPPERLLDEITAHAESRGISIEWDRDGDAPVARIRYQPQLNRTDVVLDDLRFLDGQVRLMGHSEEIRATALKLPSRRVLQSTFPRRNVQPPAEEGPPDADRHRRRNSTTPTHSVPMS